MRHAAELEAFFRSNNPLLWRFTCRISYPDKQSSYDIYQDAWVRIIDRYWERMRPRSEGERINYVKSVILSTYRNHKRSVYGGRFRECATEDGFLLAEPYEQIIDMTGEDQALFHLNGLTCVQRQVVWLRSYYEFPVREVAAILGICEGTVKSTHSRALEKLRGSVCRFHTDTSEDEYGR
jgi:RNA polymerase sigma factor (sigma-70 family)